MQRAKGAGRGGPARQPAAAGPGGQGEPPPKILVVDDDPDIVRATRLLLEGQGYRVVTAASAPEAKQALAAERPSLVLLDIMMPTGTEGFHFVWDLRRDPDPALRDIPIIVMSAIHRTTDLRLYPEEADQEYAPGEFLPVQAFLDKPVDLRELVHVVENTLAGRRHP